MKITMLEGRHLTATNRAHIASVIEQRLFAGHSKRISYYVTDRNEDVYSIRIEQIERNDYGKPVKRVQNVVVKVTA